MCGIVVLLSGSAVDQNGFGPVCCATVLIVQEVYGLLEPLPAQSEIERQVVLVQEIVGERSRPVQTDLL
jgi:hypothetical protein